MNIDRRTCLKAAAATAATWLGGAQAQGSAPLESARILVGFTAGTTPDVLARKVGSHLTKGYARSAVVDNKTGAGGQLAVTALKEGPADGSNMLVTAMSILGVYPHTYSKLPYDPMTDVAPVSLAARFDYGVFVGAGVPDSVKTVHDLMAWYKANPDKANIGSPATGSTLHFTGIMLGRAAGVPLTHVGYRGSTAALQDLLSGNLPALVTPSGTFLNQPKVRVLATSGAKRSRFMPQVPTLAEEGFPDLVFDEWYGFFLPGKASAPTVQRLNAVLKQALAQPDVVETLASFGMEAESSTPEQLAQLLAADTKRWGPIVKSIGFRADS